MEKQTKSLAGLFDYNALMKPKQKRDGLLPVAIRLNGQVIAFDYARCDWSTQSGDAKIIEDRLQAVQRVEMELEEVEAQLIEQSFMEDMYKQKINEINNEIRRLSNYDSQLDRELLKSHFEANRLDVSVSKLDELKKSMHGGFAN